jgi:hypothetical protein
MKFQATDISGHPVPLPEGLPLDPHTNPVQFETEVYNLFIRDPSPTASMVVAFSNRWGIPMPPYGEVIGDFLSHRVMALQIMIRKTQYNHPTCPQVIKDKAKQWLLERKCTTEL